jgi:hypothetical protein
LSKEDKKRIVTHSGSAPSYEPEIPPTATLDATAAEIPTNRTSNLCSSPAWLVIVGCRPTIYPLKEQRKYNHWRKEENIHQM